MEQGKNQITCGLVKDLLPLYVDEICSEESHKLVVMHLNECEECKAYMEKMGQPVLEETLKNDSTQIIARHKRKIKDQMVGIAMLSVVVTLLVIALGWVILYTGGSIEKEYLTIQTTEYGNWDGHIDLERQCLDSGLLLFPDKISSAPDADYLYYCGADTHSIYQYLIYAEVTYTETDYEKEMERIANTKCQVKLSAKGETVTNKVQYSEDLFVYPAYVAIYGANLSYEYALVDEENHKIVYVYLQMKDGNGVIPQEYLPKGVWGKDMYEDNSWDNLNIYFAEDEFGNYVYYEDCLETDK